MIIGFHSNQLNIRGSEVALYDYAKYNIELLHNQSIIFSPSAGDHNLEIIEKFKKIFLVVFYESLSDLESKLKLHLISIFYAIKSGHNDGLLPNGVRNCVHSVFKSKDLHGDRYAYVSEWLSNEMSNGKTPYVPHIVELSDTKEDFRDELNIKKEDIVFGRHGGYDTFDIPFTKRVIYNLAIKNPNFHFLFLNTENFLESKNYFKSQKINNILGRLFYPKNIIPNIKFLPQTTDIIYKTKFINTCNAMLHGRVQGETFGISCGEFSIKNKPVITCDADFVSDKSHIQILGKNGVYYQNEKTLIEAIYSIKTSTANNYDAYSEKFNKVAVMKKFKQVFLD